MGYLLKEALKTLCGVNQWSYAIFWKIGCQNPKLLIWEECYYEPTSYSGVSGISTYEHPELALEDWKSCRALVESHSSQLGIQQGGGVNLLVEKLMLENHINILGEGLVGRAAFTGNHQWILSENYAREAHPPEVLKELSQQFSVGMQTVAVIPVLPHGVVQLASKLVIMESIGFINEVKTLVLQLGSVPGILLSDNYSVKQPTSKIATPVCPAKSTSLDSSWSPKLFDSHPIIADSCNYLGLPTQTPAFVGQTSYSSIRQIEDTLQSIGDASDISDMMQHSIKSQDVYCLAKAIPVRRQNMFLTSHLANEVAKAEVIPSNPEIWLARQASVYNPTSTSCQQLARDLGVNIAGGRSKEQEFMSNSGSQGHAHDSLCMSCGFMKQVVSNCNEHGHLNHGLNMSNDFIMSQGFPISNENSLTILSSEVSGLSTAISSHQKSVPEVNSIFHTNELANRSLTCTPPVAIGSQSGNITKLDMSSSDMVDHLTTNHLVSSVSVMRPRSMDNGSIENVLHTDKERVENDLFQAVGIQLMQRDGCTNLSESNVLNNDQKHEVTGPGLLEGDAKYGDASGQQQSGDDLFDILGADFKSKLFNDCWSDMVSNGSVANAKVLNENNSSIISQDVAVSVKGNTDFPVAGFDHLLDIMLSKPSTMQSLDDTVSCRTTLTNMSSSSFPSASCSNGSVRVSNKSQGELYGFSKCLAKDGAQASCSFRSGSSKDNAGNHSSSSSIYGSQISSWVEQGHDMKQTGSVSTAYSKGRDEVSKTSRKRLKPGENPRPRPKDRQMIQDRVKELREIVPNGAKCSIDALLERTIKHMLFLQSVTKHADKLKQTGESKIVSKEGGLLLKDNFEGGATWAYEVGSQSMVCPIIVEDLNQPRQMLVEMLCEERGLFLEIADIIRGLGLTILKGVMETRNDKIWARFAVEANRDVTRMEIFLSLVRLLEQTTKSNGASTSGMDKEAKIINQFHQSAPIHATVQPCSLQ